MVYLQFREMAIGRIGVGSFWKVFGYKLKTTFLKPKESSTFMPE